jgi:hypothetical protein
MTAVLSTACDRPTVVTRSLVAYGAVAGPGYVTVSLAQALTREGFDLTRHPWSLLANGDLGWIQVANLAVTGLMTLAFAAGLRRAGAGVWGPRLIAVFGLSLVLAGVFVADPALGFPVGTPAAATPVSWHGLAHFAVGAVGFGCVAAAGLVLGARFAAAGHRGWARYSRLTGVLFLATFAAVASGRPGTVPVFVAGVVALFTWLTLLSVRTYRELSA